MRRILSLLMFLILVGTLVSCESGNTGNFKIRLKLPIDTKLVCQEYVSGETDEDADYTYCINNTDQIMLSIYSTPDPAEPYTIVDRKLIKVDNNKGGKAEFIRSLKKGSYYRFFVEVTNANEKLKLTGGVDGINYDDDDNYVVDIFLGATADFVRVVSDRVNYESSSLKSYFESSGSKGSAAVALKNGKVYLSGGYSFDYEDIRKNTMIFNMGKLSSGNAASLPTPVMDHAAALLDDGSEAGVVIVAFGATEEGNSNQILAYYPDSDKYKTIGIKDTLTKAKAISIDGDVYIVGGCNGKNNTKKVYKVSKTAINLTVEDFADLNTGRCNHSIADVSTVDLNGKITPRILVIGGSTDEDGEVPVLGNFAEVVTAGKSTDVEITDRAGADVSELLTKGLVSSAATTIKLDDKDKIEKVVAVVGGYLQDGEVGNTSLIISPSLYIFSEVAGKDKWIYDVNGAPNNCARPSMVTIGTTEKSAAQYAAVNCGTGEISRDQQSADTQIVFVLQVKRTFNSDLGIEIFSASVKESLMEENKDPDNGVIVDGPVAVNSLGQAFVFGTEFVYQISGYSIPY